MASKALEDIRKNLSRGLALDTKILMFDGTLKKVQDILIGDQIMGDDSRPRNIISTCFGQEQMYDIKLENGDRFTCTESHNLSLKYKEKYKRSIIVDIPVKDYMQLGICIRCNLFGYKAAKIDYPSQPISHDPYEIGTKTTCVIPRQYLCNSHEIRLQVLAGILDTLAIYNKKLNLYTIMTIEEHIIHLARSLGFTINVKKKCINLSGKGLYDIPVRNLEKRSYSNSLMMHNKRKLIRLTSWPSSVKDYYGFEIDGNQRCVLEDFTVTNL